jgi:hypothetical protein
MLVIKNQISDAVVRRINENIARGRASRRSLGVKLAEMPPREIAKLPRSVLMRIGPEGIATMARVAAGTDDILPAKRSDIPVEQSEKPQRARLPLWQLCSGLALIVIILTILAGALERPGRWALARTGMVMPHNAGLCARLDRWTDHCTYVVTGSAASIADVTNRLVLDVDALSVVNPHLPVNIPLPAGTIIRIDRNSWR